MLRFPASKLLIRNLNLLKGAFLYITGEEGSVYSNPTNQLKKIWRWGTEEIGVLANYSSEGLTLEVTYQSL